MHCKFATTFLWKMYKFNLFKDSVTLPMIHLRRDPSGGPKSTYSYILSLPK